MKKRLFGLLCILAVLISFVGCRADQEGPYGSMSAGGSNTAVDDAAAPTDTGVPSGMPSAPPIVTMHPEYPTRTLDELVQKSALIVHAKKIGENPARMDDRLDAAVTDYHFEVLDIYHGDKKVGDTITVEFDYGTVDGTAYGSGAYRVLENGREALMILSYPTDAEDEITTTERYVFYPPGGIFYGTGDGQFQALNGGVFTPSAFKEKVTTILENVIK